MSFLALLGANAACGVAGNTISCLCFQLPWGPSRGAKILTAVLFWVVSLAAFVMYQWGPESVLRLQSLGAEAGKMSVGVLRYYAVVRIMMGLSLFHGLQAVLLVGVTSSRQQRSVLQMGLWPVKFLVAVVVAAASFWMPQWLVARAYWLAVALSVLFILAQVVLLIDMACSWAETLVSKYEETEGPVYKFALIGLTLGFYSVLLGGSVFLFVRYSLVSDRLFVGLNIVLAVVMTACSLSERVRDAYPGAGIFPSALIGTYNLYLMSSAFLSRPANESIAPSGQMRTLISTLGYVFAFLSVGYSAYSTGSKAQKLVISKSSSRSSIQTPSKYASASDVDEAESTYNYSLFHAVFMCAALYVALVMTQWKEPQMDADKGLFVLANTEGAFWVKLVTSWVQSALYVWTLFAPVFFADRDFSA